MLDNLNCGPHSYGSHEASFAMENEYQSGGSMQMMPPHYNSKQQNMSYSSGAHGPNYGGHGWHHGGGGRWPAHSGTGYYGHGSAPGPMHGGPGQRMSSSNMMSSEYHAGPGRMRMHNYGMHAESYDDYAAGAHGGRQKVEWKAL